PRGGGTQVEALAVVHPQGPERLDLPFALDPLGDDRDADVIGEGHERGGQGTPCALHVDVPGQGEVQLDEVGAQLEDVAQAGVARADVVDGHAPAVPPELSEGSVQLGVVRHRHVV